MKNDARDALLTLTVLYAVILFVCASALTLWGTIEVIL